VYVTDDDKHVGISPENYPMSILQQSVTFWLLDEVEFAAV
jgi:hypothetical protein